MIVDDHEMVRNGLSTFLLAYDDLELVGEASSGAEGVRMAAELRPDVVLMDLVMPGMDGATATKSLLQQVPEARVIALTSYRDDDLLQRVLQAGATSYLLKNISAD